MNDNQLPVAESIPRAAKSVAVVGAGIVGVSTAIWLQRAGHHVTLIDREGPAAGTSYGNAGVLAACAVVPVTVPGLLAKAPKLLFDPNSPLFMRWGYFAKLLPWLGKYLRHCNPYDASRIARALTPILGDTLEQHQALARGTGAEEFIKPTDYLFVYRDRSEFDDEKFAWQVRADCGFEWQELDRAALIEKDPAFTDGDAGFGISVGKHGFITDPGRYVQTLAEHFERQGGDMIKASVEDLRVSDGRVTAVETRVDGIPGTVECEVAVIATGIWSESLSRKLGLKVPMEAERGYHVEFYNASRMPIHPSMISSGKFVATPMRGRLRCAGIVEFGGLTSTRSAKPLALLRNKIQSVMPGLKYDHSEEWLGYRPAPTDSIPLIGEFDILAGAFAGFGHQHVGLTGGPKTGRLLAALISGDDPGIDMTPYRTDRFH